jgi:hypothetical protein
MEFLLVSVPGFALGHNGKGMLDYLYVVLLFLNKKQLTLKATEITILPEEAAKDTGLHPTSICVNLL